MASSVHFTMEPVELRKTGQRWIRFSKRKEENIDDMESTKVFRKFLAILNKLTPQNFKDLAEQALKLPLSSIETLKGCVNLVFEKVDNYCLYCV